MWRPPSVGSSRTEDQTSKRQQVELVRSLRRRVNDAVAQTSPAGLLVAVSGGQDSVCLLDALNHSEASAHLVVCHVDHGLRTEAAEESRLVDQLSSRRGIECVVRKVDTPAIMAAEGLSMEMAARRARYETLRSVAAERGIEMIALGHTADDQAESVLMHVLRGAGLRGLGGMRVLEAGLFRPLLSVWRSETAAYCDALDVAFVSDPSNEDRSLPRNRIRHEIIPQSEQLFPGSRRSLVRLAEVSRRDDDYLDELTDPALKRISRPEGLEPSLWKALPQSLRYRVLRRFLKKEGEAGSSTEVDESIVQMNEIWKDCLHDPIDHFSAVATLESASPVPLSVPGRTRVGSVFIDATIMRRTEDVGRRVAVASAGEAYFDLDVVRGRLSLRPWRHGDRMQPLGSPGARKVQDIFVDLKVPASQRPVIPILTGDDRIYWIVGIATDESARVTPKTSNVVHIAVALPR